MFHPWVPEKSTTDSRFRHLNGPSATFDAHPELLAPSLYVKGTFTGATEMDWFTSEIPDPLLAARGAQWSRISVPSFRPVMIRATRQAMTQHDSSEADILKLIVTHAL